MYTAVYTFSRLIVFGSGWGLVAVFAFLADLMVTGTFWPLFVVIAGWWTFACAIYVQGEALPPFHPDNG